MAEKEFSIFREILLSNRLEALKQGKYTDCSFLVGPEGTELKEVHGVKSIMMWSSGFMEGLFNSPLCPPNPVRISNVEPHIFELIVEFLHLTEFISKVDCMDAVEIAIAADHLLIDNLKMCCTSVIKSKVTVDNVWSVLNRVLEFNMEDVAKACSQILTEETNECVEHPEFLTASSASVNCLLSLDVLSITSENQLIEHCWKWATHQENEREAMRNLLPGIRFLSLSPTSAAQLPDFLTDAERASILEYCITKSLKSNFPQTICSTTAPREYELKEMVQPIILENNIETSADELAKFTTNYAISNKISFKPAQDLYLTGISCFGVILEEASSPGIEFNSAKKIYQKKIPKQTTFNCSVTLRGIGNSDQNWELTNLACDSCWVIKPKDLVLMRKNVEYSINILFRPNNCNYYSMVKRNEDDVNNSLLSLLNPRAFSSLNVSWSTDYHSRNPNGLCGPIFLQSIKYVINR